jgi:hypothetical protein
VIIDGTPTLARPLPSVDSWPFRRSCAVEIGGLPGIEKDRVAVGRS